MKIKVTPAYGYAHGHAEKILIAIGASSICTDPDGIVTAEVTPQQFEMFQLRGVAHRAEVLPDPSAIPPGPPALTLEKDSVGRTEEFQTLTCPACEYAFQVLHDGTPRDVFEIPCEKCGATLTIDQKPNGDFVIAKSEPLKTVEPEAQHRDPMGRFTS